MFDLIDPEHKNVLTFEDLRRIADELKYNLSEE